MTINNPTQANFIDTSAAGRASSNPFVDFFAPRDPTPEDVNFPIQKKWLNTTSESLWMLENFVTSSGVITAHWIELTSTAPSGAREVQVDIATPPGVNPVVPDSGGLITVTGNQIAAGSTAHVIRTDTTDVHQWTIEVQRSQAVTSSTVEDNGVCHFDSNDFTVDSNAFVQTKGGEFLRKVHVNTSTAPGTNPVVSDATGTINVTGAQVAAGTTTNVIRTDSLAANTWTIEVQRSQAVASSTIGDNGVCHFDSSIFNVDPNAFVTLDSSFYRTGTWTPLIIGSTSAGVATYTLQTGVYSKIGNVVFFTFSVGWSSTTGTGNLYLGGFPVAIGSGATGLLNCVAALDAVALPNTTGIYLTYFLPTTMGVDTQDTPTGNLGQVPLPAHSDLFFGSGFYFSD